MSNKFTPYFCFAIFHITKGYAINLDIRMLINTNYFAIRFCCELPYKSTLAKICYIAIVPFDDVETKFFKN